MARHATPVLLVEGDPAMLRFIRRTLEIDGFSVTSATDGPSALDLFEVGDADLVLLDIGIPEINGLDVCHRLKQMRPVPVILVTARGRMMMWSGDWRQGPTITWRSLLPRGCWWPG